MPVSYHYETSCLKITILHPLFKKHHKTTFKFHYEKLLVVNLLLEHSITRIIIVISSIPEVAKRVFRSEFGGQLTNDSSEQTQSLLSIEPPRRGTGFTFIALIWGFAK